MAQFAQVDHSSMSAVDNDGGMWRCDSSPLTNAEEDQMVFKQRQTLFDSFRVLISLQACPQGSKNFRDVQCGRYNGRDIFINGERATWMSYVRGIKATVVRNPALY